MKRRDFFSLVSGGLGATAFISCSKEFLNEPSLVSAARPGGGGGGTLRYPLRVPATVTNPNGYLLDCQNAGSLDVGGKSVSNLWSYNGKYPADTLVATKGGNVVINMVNHLPEETITHWHGMIVNHENDGGPMLVVNTSGSYPYNFQVIQRAALNWYHPHPHMLTGKQVNLGMAGAFIIRDAEETGIGLPSGNYEIPLIIRDVTIDKSGSISYKPTSGGFNGQAPMVNGILNPYLQVDKAVYRFRILNGANSRIFGLALSNGGSVKLIGNDGGLLPSASLETRMDIAPAERLDILIDFRNLSGNLMLKDMRSGWDLLEFRVSGTSNSNFNYATSISSAFTPLSSPLRTRVFSFDGMTKINGLEYSMDRIDWQVPFGETEKWVFKTNGNAPHPVHIHGASFQVISRTGGRGRTYPWEAGWKDTVLLEDSETVEVLIRFDGYKGKYLMHCHKLEHEDLGMMANFEVI
jgi:FtsP/CotA-like multicopper oxidase with cupredoxin domain